MSYFPYAPKIGDIYTLLAPPGARAVFNDVTDPDYVGVLSEVTGLDSAEVRESSEDLASADGGQHGYFYYGRRPITMTGKLYDHTSEQMRDARWDKIKRASNAMQADATLSWKPRRVKDAIALNGGFEVDASNSTTTSFALSAGATAVRTTSQSHIGAASLQIDATATNQGVALLTKDLKKDTPYRVSFWVKGNAGGEQLDFYFSDSSGNYYGPAGQSSVGGVNATTSWQKVSFFVTPSADLVSPRLQVRTINPAAMRYFVDSFAVHDFIEMYTPVRRQQPVRLSGNWIKDFQLSLVSEFTPLFSNDLYTLSGSGIIENHGDYPSPPTIIVNGVGPSTVVANNTTGAVLRFTSAASGVLVVDVATRQATNNGILSNQMVDFVNSTWPTVRMGLNSFSISGPGSLSLSWRDAWT